MIACSYMRIMYYFLIHNFLSMLDYDNKLFDNENNNKYVGLHKKINILLIL